MKKKGFTLIELLAVIVILAIILLIAVPQVLDVIEDVKNNAYISTNDLVVEAAELYMASHIDELPTEEGSTTIIELASDLQGEGFIDEVSSMDNTCSGYVTVTKTDEDKFSYEPYVNCSSTTINIPSDDGLVLNYTFDGFEEPTENLLSVYSLVQDEYDQSNKPGVFEYLTNVQGTYTLSAIIKRYSDDNCTVPRMTLSFIYSDSTNDVYYIGTNTIPADNNDYFYEVTATTDPLKTLTKIKILFFDYSTVVSRHIEGRNFQLEKKDHSTPFVDGSREGIIKDYSSNSNTANLTLDGIPKWVYDEERQSGVYKFDGAQYILTDVIPEINNLNGIDNSFTISLWAKGTSFSNTYNGFLNALSETGDYAGFLLSFANGEGSVVRARYWQEGGTNVAWSTSSFQNNWGYITAVISGGIVSMYENGELVKTETYINPFPLGGQISIGYYLFSNNYLNGYIDDVRIYSRALNDEEVKELYLITK